jgi:hypothetical protein
MDYLGWFDDNPKRPAAQRIADACAAYARRCGQRATVVLVNEADKNAPATVPLRAVAWVRKDHYFAGVEHA